MAALNFLILCAIFAILVLLIRRITEFYLRWLKLRKIPTFTAEPRLGPFLGNLPMAFKAETEFFSVQRDIAKKYFPIYKCWMFESCFISILDVDDCKQILNQKHEKSLRFFHNWLGDGILLSEGSLWQFRRKMIQQFFSVKNLERLVVTFNEEVEQTVATQLGPGVIEVHSEFTKLLFNAIIRMTLGDNLHIPKEQYRKNYERIMHLVTLRYIHKWKQNNFLYKFTKEYQEEMKNVDIFNEVSLRAIQNRGDLFDDGDTLLDFFLKCKMEGKIDDMGIRDELTTLIVGGYDTGSSTIATLLMLLANHADIQERLYREIMEIVGETGTPTYRQLLQLEFAECCIKETLRLYASAPIVIRRTMFPIVTKSGYEIPEYSTLVLHLFNSGYNPQYWPEPESFNPDRFSRENQNDSQVSAMISFGSGPRTCIGKKLGMLNVKAILCAVLRKFVLEPIDNQNTIQLYVNVVLKFKNGIKVRFVERNNE